MEQQNKYYTPDISELHVGYCNYQVCYKKDIWTDAVPIVDGTQIDNVIDLLTGRVGFHSGSHVRTKYLDQSDIESCGWEIDVEKEKRRKNHVTAPYISKGKNGMLSQHGENYMISTIIGPPTEDSYGGLGQPMYMGPIKSINELRTIMKYLNIK